MCAAIPMFRVRSRGVVLGTVVFLLCRRGYQR
jgi:hypothetical protein